MLGSNGAQRSNGAQNLAQSARISSTARIDGKWNHLKSGTPTRVAVEAFDEAVLLALSKRDVTPIDTGFLNPFESAVRQIGTSLYQASGAVLYAAQRPRHSASAAVRFILK